MEYVLAGAAIGAFATKWRWVTLWCLGLAAAFSVLLHSLLQSAGVGGIRPHSVVLQFVWLMMWASLVYGGRLFVARRLKGAPPGAAAVSERGASAPPAAP